MKHPNLLELAAQEITEHFIVVKQPYDVQGTTQGYLSCIYVMDGGYKDASLRKLVFLLFWVMQQLWYVGFPALLVYAMMPAWFMRLEKVAAVLMLVAATAAMVIMATAFDRPLNSAIQFVYLSKYLSASFAELGSSELVSCQLC